MTMHSVELEQAVIGGLLIDPDQYPDVCVHLTPGSFVGGFEREAYTTIATLCDKGARIDFLTVAEECEKSRPTGEWLIYLANLQKNTPSAANVVSYAKGVAEIAYLRRMYAIGADLCRAAMGPGDVATRTASAQTALSEALAIDTHTGPIDTRKALQDWYQSLTHNRGANGLASGFMDLDVLTTGFHPGELVILAARPGVGKTVLALQIAANAILGGRSVMFFSLEMQTSELISRLAACQTGVSHHAIKTGDLSSRQWIQLGDFATETAERRLYISDKPDQHISAIRAQARSQKNRTGLDLVIVDYLQLAHGDGESDTVRVGAVSRGLKALAKELNCPVLALSQFSRSVEQRADGRPRLSDLRSSGQIEQDADLVMFLHRAGERSTELIVEKNRHGRTGHLWLEPMFHEMKFIPGVEPLQEPVKPSKGLEW